MMNEYMTFQESIRQLNSPMGKIFLILFDELGSRPLYGVRRGTTISWKELAYEHLQLQTCGNLWLELVQPDALLGFACLRAPRPYAFLFRVNIERTPS